MQCNSCLVAFSLNVPDVNMCASIQETLGIYNKVKSESRQIVKWLGWG